MDSLATENWPETCSVLGLECSTCIHYAASSVASICGGLESQGIRQIFFELYSSPGCRPMAQAFEVAYQEAAAPKLIPVLATAAAA
jgi:hypothetical protein